MTSEPTLRRVTPRPATGLAAAAAVSGGSARASRAAAAGSWDYGVQDDRADAVVAQLLHARPVGEVLHAAAQVVDRRHVEGAVADGNLVEAVGREVLPDAIERAVGREVEDGPGQADLGRAGCGTTGWPRCPAPSPRMPISEHDADAAQARERAPRAPTPARPSTRAGREQLRAGAGEQRENSVASVKIRPGTRTPSQPGAKSYSSR